MRIGRIVAGLVLALAVVGCTPNVPPPDVPPPDGSTSADPSVTPTPTGPIDPGTADPPSGVMATQTAGTSVGGNLTVTLRSVQVQGGVMTVRWAFRWDDDKVADTHIQTMLAVGVAPATITVSDTVNLKLYRPFCTRGSWKASLTFDCRDSALVSTSSATRFINHGTFEVSALMPAPEGKPETVVVIPSDGLPTFTDAKVTYLS